jgi:hypothetical protein
VAGLKEQLLDCARNHRSERTQVEVPADDLTQLLDHMEGVALHAGQGSRAHRGVGEVGIQALRHQQVQRLRQFTAEIGTEPAGFHQAVDTPDGAGLGQAAFQRQAADSVDDGEDAAFFKVDRLAGQLVEQPDRRREGVGGTGEIPT